MSKMQNIIIYIIMPSILLITGVVLIAFGIWRGELQIIMEKAVMVCLECIGIG